MSADYARMSHAQLLTLRDQLHANDPMQAVLAPYEHAAFAREWTQANPLAAVPSLAVAIPGYTAAKFLGLTHSRSPASLLEMGQSYRGVGQGLLALMGRMTHGTNY
jgi:hypothetical protein